MCYALLNNYEFDHSNNLSHMKFRFVDRRFRGTCCHHTRPDDGVSTYHWNVGRQLFYTAVYPRRQFWTSYSPPWELEISHTFLTHCVRVSIQIRANIIFFMNSIYNIKPLVMFRRVSMSLDHHQWITKFKILRGLVHCYDEYFKICYSLMMIQWDWNASEHY
jgi:hypothetical protein